MLRPSFLLPMLLQVYFDLFTLTSILSKLLTKFLLKFSYETIYISCMQPKFKCKFLNKYFMHNCKFVIF